MSRGPFPNGCAHCGIPERVHQGRWSDAVGWHLYAEPDDIQRAARAAARAKLAPTLSSRPAEPAAADAEAALAGYDADAYLQALALVREYQRFEKPLTAAIRARDAACPAEHRELTQAAFDRRTLLGLLDRTGDDLMFALEDNEVLEARMANTLGACERLARYAHTLAATDPAGAGGINRAVNVITRALNTYALEPEERT